MEPHRDDQLIADLQALRPAPRPQFAAELDERAAAGFPRRTRLPRVSFERLSAIPPRRLLLPLGGVALAVLAIATAIVSLDSSGSGSEEIARSGSTFAQEAPPHSATNDSYHAGRLHLKQAETTAMANEAAGAEAGSTAFEAESQVLPSEAPTPGEGTFRLHHRAVERSAEITLAADPKDVNDDASRVFEAVHANNGIVMRSSTEEGRPGEAGATFELLIPSAKLGDALAAFSQIDAVRSRHEATADITAPTVAAAELLKESRARIDSLLAQLEGAGTEEEQEAIEAELRHERRHASRLAAQVNHLHKRADFSRVSLRIETGGKDSSGGGGAWGFDDALHDAGHVLTVAAAVTLVALAVLGPIALIVLLAWLTHRAWVRRERRRVLS